MIGREGAISSKAGLIAGETLVAVNGDAYSTEVVKAALKAGVGKTGGVDLLIKAGDRYRTVHIAYDGGLRYPHLEKAGGGAGSLEAIAAPRS